MGTFRSPRLSISFTCGDGQFFQLLTFPAYNTPASFSYFRVFVAQRFSCWRGLSGVGGHPPGILEYVVSSGLPLVLHKLYIGFLRGPSVAQLVRNPGMPCPPGRDSIKHCVNPRTLLCILWCFFSPIPRAKSWYQLGNNTRTFICILWSNFRTHP